MVLHEGTLQLIAELSIGLAGFAGIVAALGRRAQGEWDPQERARLESLLWAAGGGVVFSVAPLVVASSGLPEVTIWRVGNGVFALAHVVVAAWFFQRRGLTLSSQDTDARILAAVVPIVGALVGGLILGQLAVALGFLTDLGAFLYQTALLWCLVVGLLQFVFLLLRTRAA